MILPGMPKPLAKKMGGANIIGVAIASGQASHTRIDNDGNTLSGAQYDFGGSYYATHGAFAFSDETIDGQSMVRIPAMYYRRAPITTGPHSGKEGWWVADGPTEGFVLHPAFMKGGSPINHFWVGKYQGVNDGGTKLGSFGGTTPLVNLNISTFKTRADARNVSGQSGWMMWSFYQIAVIQMLAMIEMASTDSQATIGQGRVSQSSVGNVNDLDVSTATYRGLVGIWGNVQQIVDGIDYVSSVVRLWDRLGYKGWVSTGLATKPIGFPTAMNNSSGVGFDFRDVFFAVSINSNDFLSTWRDQQSLSSSGDRIANFGGRWNSGILAGLWCLDLSSTPSSINTGTGSRLAKEP